MNEQANKKQNRMLFWRFMYTAGLGLLVLVFIILYLHFSYGWFANSDTVSADGMQVTANDDTLFELAVRDRNTVLPANTNYDPNLDQTSPYAANSMIATFLGDDAYGGYETLSETSNDHPAIFCHLVNENPHEENSEDLAPGAFGLISFDIVVPSGYSGDFDIDLSFFPLGINGQVPEAITDATLLNQLQELLSGHILFYQNRSVKQNGGYYYTNRLVNDSFVYELSGHTPTVINGKAHYTVEIYWIWPSTFGQLALPNGDERVHNHSVYNDETERQAILTFISTNPGKFFRELEGNNNFQNGSGQGWESLNFIALSEAYNRADQLIGDNAQYLIVCVDVQQH